MPGFSFFVTLLMGLGALGLRRFRSSIVGVALAAGVIVAVVGVGVDLAWLADVGVVAAAITLGVVVGRAIPPRAAPIVLVLAMLSIADIVWIASEGGLSSDWADQLLNFSIQGGTGSSSIGTLDLVLAAALAAHWLERGARIALSLAAAPLGVAIADIYVGLSGIDNLPLIPFITLGWLITEVVHRLSQSRRKQAT